MLGLPRCLGFGGSRVDAAVAAELLRALEPLAIDAAHEDSAAAAKAQLVSDAELLQGPDILGRTHWSQSAAVMRSLSRVWSLEGSRHHRSWVVESSGADLPSWALSSPALNNILRM